MSNFGVAMVGVGMVSSTYAAAFDALHNSLTLCGVMSRGEDSARAYIDQYGSAFPDLKMYRAADEIAQDHKVDAVILCTPPDARREFIEMFAAAGKAILMEKPLERTLPAARELCEIAEKHAVPLGIVLQHRVRPSALQLHEVLASGNVGALRAVEISVPWWREQAYYDEPGRGSYQRDGGGVLISQAIHTLDLALQYTGAVESVSAMAATTDFHRMESEDFVSGSLRFASGAVGTLFASTACFPGRTETIRLYYENLSVLLESSTLQLKWRDGTTETFGNTGGSGSGADPMAFTADWHTAVIREFCRAVASEKPVPLPARSALAVHSLIAAIEESAAKSGFTINL